ncbi:MAG: hypothetical protein EOO75_01980, partial [Myxococcales bacterium]
MNRWLNRGWTSLGLLGIVGLASTGHGCASTDEGDYIDPPGFAPQHTQAVALSAGSFVRDRDSVLMTTGLATQRLRGESGGDKGRLGAVFHGTYADGMTVAPASQPRASLRVVPVQAKAAPARLRHDGAVVSFEEAFPHVTSAFGARDSRVEEFLVIPEEKDVPALAYDLTPGPDFDRLEGRDGDSVLWAYAHDGDGVFTIQPPSADDAAGKHIEGSWILEKTATGYRITAQIDLHGLQYPVLLDPTFETPQWFPNTDGQPSAISGAAGAFDIPSGCTVIFGGFQNPAGPESQETSMRCANRVWKANIPITGPKPPIRAYAAMAHLGGSVNKTFLFGGFSGGVVKNDTWSFTPTCTTPGNASTCTGTWTQVTPSGSIPDPRSYHGLAWTGSSLLLFGGAGTAGIGLRDTWSFDGTTWTNLNASFGGSNGILGFATAVAVNGPTRTVYAIGGYDNPLGGGAYTNTTYRWSGSSWQTPVTDGETIPLQSDAAGSTNGTANSVLVPATATTMFMPPVRAFHWAAGTNNNNVLIGGGQFATSATSSTFFTDTWLRVRDSISGDGWRHLPRPRREVYGPGERVLGTAVFDENLREIVLIGGETSSAQVSNAQVYRGIERTYNLIQSCTNNNCTNVYTTAVVPSVNAADCANFSALFMRRGNINSPWNSVGSDTAFTYGAHPGPNFPLVGSVCYALSGSLGAGRLDYGVRVRDNRYHVKLTGTSGDECALAADEATT